MRNLYIAVCCFIIATTSVFAQTQESVPPPAPTPSQPATPAAPARPISYSGGFGHFFTGPAWIQPQDLIDHLQSPEVFGSSFN
ncbi:MAG: hypothetical protein KA166_05230, partial [Saprospiraceae bacterium]|nr:hypothetical protein [Saprospiraceae bacterium]